MSLIVSSILLFLKLQTKKASGQAVRLFPKINFVRFLRERCIFWLYKIWENSKGKSKFETSGRVFINFLCKYQNSYSTE